MDRIVEWMDGKARRSDVVKIANVYLIIAWVLVWLFG